MMTCEVIKDLLPLYYDGVCSSDSSDLITEHLKKCKDCQELFSKMVQAEQICNTLFSKTIEMKKASILQSFQQSLNRKFACYLVASLSLIFFGGVIVFIFLLS